LTQREITLQQQYQCQSQIRYSKLSIKFNGKVMSAISTVVDYWQEFVVFTSKVFTFTLSFISKGIYSIATMKFLCRLEIPMLITTYSHNMQSYGSDNRAHIIDEGTCSSDDHCVFLSSFNCLGGNNSLYFANCHGPCIVKQP